jgi:hypothetical protein
MCEREREGQQIRSLSLAVNAALDSKQSISEQIAEMDRMIKLKTDALKWLFYDEIVHQTALIDSLQQRRRELMAQVFIPERE